jgi:hypothetical protein
MSVFFANNGGGVITVPAGARIAVYSDYTYTVQQTVGFPQYPNAQVPLFNGRGAFTSSTFSAGATITIIGGDGPLWYSVGTAASIPERMVDALPAPTALDTTGDITAAMIFGGIVTSAAATVTGTLPTGAVLDAASTMAVGDVIRWSIIKTGANAFTVAPAASGHTIVGSATVATATSASFVTRKTAAETFVTYRV